MPLSFRDASPSDAPVLAEMNRRLIKDEGHRNRMTPAELHNRMQGWLSSGEYDAAIFEQDGAPAGYALFRREPDHVYVRQFYVDPEHRRRGVGQAAVEWLCANRWRGAPRVRLDVLVGNAAGRGFWKAVGFLEYCVTMEREL
jgi:ribosomal protein S18 acetylase RimI-like enzyme